MKNGSCVPGLAVGQLLFSFLPLLKAKKNSIYATANFEYLRMPLQTKLQKEPLTTIE
jgi:hypothetical protein